jgi:hypothetical protein
MHRFHAPAAFADHSSSSFDILGQMLRNVNTQSSESFMISENGFLKSSDFFGFANFCLALILTEVKA